MHPCFSVLLDLCVLGWGETPPPEMLPAAVRSIIPHLEANQKTNSSQVMWLLCCWDAIQSSSRPLKTFKTYLSPSVSRPFSSNQGNWFVIQPKLHKPSLSLQVYGLNKMEQKLFLSTFLVECFKHRINHPSPRMLIYEGYSFYFIIITFQDMQWLSQISHRHWCLFHLQESSTVIEVVLYCINNWKQVGNCCIKSEE